MERTEEVDADVAEPAGLYDDVASLKRRELRADRLATLARALEAHRGKPAGFSRSAKLFASGTPKMAQKLVEEAAEVAIEALRGERKLLIAESADLLYNLVVLLTASGINMDEVWAEMDGREARLGLAEKLPKSS
jgi:phosphoribosyl-ATP pyrophosphohydrolase